MLRTEHLRRTLAATLLTLAGLVTSLGLLALNPMMASAQATNTPAATNAPAPAPTKTTLINPLGTTSIQTFAARAIQIFTGIAGSIALAVFVYGGFLMVTAEGNDEKFKKGKNSLVWAVIGLMVMFGSFAVLNAFFGALGVK